MKDNCPWSVQLPLMHPLHYISYPGVMPNRYTITDYGLVFDKIKNREISQFINGGYYKCNLVRVDGAQFPYSIHRLVAWEYILYHRDISLSVIHKDGNNLNNNYWNLEWVTPTTTPNVRSSRIISYPGVMPDKYSITESGVIINVITGSVLSQNINNGYYRCGLIGVDRKQHNYLVHRLVAWEFISYHRDINLHVNHKDGNKLNNNYWNLEWVTPAENVYHAISMGLTPLKIGEDHPMAKLTDQDVHQICYMLQNPWISYEQIAAKFNDKCKVAAIIGIAHGNTWTHISRHYKIPYRQWERPTGVGVWNSKLTEDDVRNICKMLEDPKYTYKEIIELLGLQDKASVTVVHKIANGSSYSDISSQYDIAPRENDRVKIARISSKLDEEKVHQICQMLQDPRIMYKYIGAKFGVCDHTILDIAKGHIWQDISSQYEIPDRSSKNHAVSKLNISQVYQICEMLRDPYITYRSIANELGVSASCIQGIANGYNWPEISSQFNIPQRIRKKTSNPNYKN